MLLKIKFKRGAAMTAVTAALLLGGTQDARSFGYEDYLASVSLFAGTFCPRDSLPTDGRLLDINTNQSLYSLLGTVYGGDGRTTFGLPNLKSPVKGARYCITIRGIFPPRS